MSEKSFSVYKNIPVKYKIQKPRYWYKEKIVVPKVDGEVFEEELEPFEGVNIKLSSRDKFVRIEETKLWNGLVMEPREYIFAPKGEKYLAVIDGVEYSKQGKPSVSEYIVSGLSKSAYLTIPPRDLSSTNHWEIKLKYNPKNVNTEQFLFCTTASDSIYGVAFGIEQGKAKVLISLNGSNWDIAWNYDIEANVWQYVKIIYDSTTGYRIEHSKDGKQYIVVGENETTDKISFNLVNAIIGYLYNYSSGEAWNGAIDLSGCNIEIGYDIVWGMGSEYKTIKLLPGCGGFNDYFGSTNFTYVMYRDRSDGMLSLELMEIADPEGGFVNPEGKDWLGYLTIPGHYKASYYDPIYYEVNNPVYSMENENVLVNLYNNKALVLKTPYYYPIQSPSMTFFDYDIRLTIRARTNTNNESRRIIVPEGAGFSKPILIANGKFAFYQTLTSDSALTTNVFYWLRVGENFNSSTRQFTHRIAYIKDEGYTKDTLPDESQWVVKTLTNTTPWFVADQPLEMIGYNLEDNLAWNGEIDLTNTWIDLGVKSEHTWVYETKWCMGDMEVI